MPKKSRKTVKPPKPIFTWIAIPNTKCFTPSLVATIAKYWILKCDIILIQEILDIIILYFDNLTFHYTSRSQFITIKNNNTINMSNTPQYRNTHIAIINYVLVFNKLRKMNKINATFNFEVLINSKTFKNIEIGFIKTDKYFIPSVHESFETLRRANGFGIEINNYNGTSIKTGVLVDIKEYCGLDVKESKFSKENHIKRIGKELLTIGDRIGISINCERNNKIMNLFINGKKSGFLCSFGMEGSIVPIIVLYANNNQLQEYMIQWVKKL